MKNSKDLRRVREAKVLFGSQLLRHVDTHGIGIGYKRKHGKKTDILCLVVHVHKKRPLEQLEKRRVLPATLTFVSSHEQAEISVATDIREAPVPTPEVECGDCTTNFGDFYRPVFPGLSISVEGWRVGGTLGGWVWDVQTQRIAFLTCHHVIGGWAGEHVVQPSFADGDGEGFVIGEVGRAGSLDAAIGYPEWHDLEWQELIEFENSCTGAAIFEIADATLGMEVEKVGPATGLTCGIVELIDYDSEHYGSHNDLWIDGDGSDFSSTGDSGAVYLERDHPEGLPWKRAVGLHWAGPDNDGVGHPIRSVFRDLGVDTVCSGIGSWVEEMFKSMIAGVRFGQFDYVSAEFVRQMGGSFYSGISRDFEKRIKDSEIGSVILSKLRAHRVDISSVLIDGDGRRASTAALLPILAGKVTTDEILDHHLSKQDIKNIQRLMGVAKRLKPSVKPFVEYMEELLLRAEGRSVGSIICGTSHHTAK